MASKTLRRTPLSPWDTLAPLCVGGVLGCAMFSLIPGLPSPTSASGCPLLFGWFIGTIPESDSSETCLSAVWHNAFSDRSRLCEPRSFRGLPVLVHVVSQRVRVLRLRRADLPLAINATGRVAFPSRETVGDPGSQTFRSSIARPTDALVYASTETSRRQSQDSGSRWSSLSPFLYDSFIRYNMPVHPGARRGRDANRSAPP